MTARMLAARLARFEKVQAFREKIRKDRPAFEIITYGDARAEQLRALGYAARTWRADEI